MSLLARLTLLFVGIPLLELFILLQMGRLVGFLPTIALVIITGLAGAALARVEGLRTIWSVRGELAKGRLPGSALLDGLAILVGGALLLTPGILTDLLGFSFLLPPTRRVLLKRVRRSLENGIKTGSVRVIHFSGFGGIPGFPAGPAPSGPHRGDSTPGVVGRAPEKNGEIVVEAEESARS